jgi:hypothetical protein
MSSIAPNQPESQQNNEPLIGVAKPFARRMKEVMELGSDSFEASVGGADQPRVVRLRNSWAIESHVTQLNRSLNHEAQQKEKTIVFQEADKAKSAFTAQISRLQSLTDDEFDRLDPSNLEPIKATIRREI